MLLVIFALGLVGGLFSGLLGIGGAVILIPLLLLVPPLAGAGQLDMGQVAGLTMIQVLVASLTAFIAHKRSGFAHRNTVLSIGIPMGIFSFAGAAASVHLSHQAMMIIFGILLTLASILLFERPDAKKVPEVRDFEFRIYRFCICGALLGFMLGVVGAGGGFILIPVMYRVLKIPMRIAVGSSLGIIFIAAIMGSIGKIIAMQVEWPLVAPIVLGSIPAALLGSQISKRLPSAHLRRFLIALIFVILLKTWYDIAIYILH